MRKIRLEYESVRQSVSELKNTRVILYINKGRKKIVRFCGTLLDVYPSVFTVKIEGSKSLDIQSYSFSDVLCGDVQVTAFEERQNASEIVG